MSIRRISTVASVWLFATLVVTAVSSAQTSEVQPPEVRRPFRGLFGAPAGPDSKQSLTFTASIFDAYDDDVYAADQGLATLSPGLRRSGWFQGVEGGLAYAVRGRRIGFAADAGAGVTRYPDQPIFAVYRTAASVNAQVARYTSLSVAESLVYAPEFRLGLFVSPTNPGAFEDPFVDVTPDLGVFRERSYRTSSNIGLTQTLRNGRLEGYYSALTANYADRILNYVSQGAGARYSRPLSRNAGFRLGYGYGIGRYPNSPSFSRRGVHNIDAGIDYGRALSVSRRTHFSFSTGSALFYANQALIGGGDRRLNYALLGSASLNHEMARTWTTSISYRRSVDFHEGFADPFVSQSVGADLRGLLSRRLRFSSSASYARGVVGAGTDNDFDSAGANAGLEYGLTRYLAAYVNYVYYRYNFDNTAVAIDPRFPRALARNGVRIGLSTSIPLIRAK